MEAVLEAAVAKTANDAVLGALATAGASTTGADLTAVVQAVAADWGSNLIIITPIWTPETEASGIPVIVDPTAPQLMVVAASGVSAKIVEPTASDDVVPARFGTDLARAVMVCGPVIGPGAVGVLA